MKQWMKSLLSLGFGEEWTRVSMGWRWKGNEKREGVQGWLGGCRAPDSGEIKGWETPLLLVQWTGFLFFLLVFHEVPIN